MDAEDEDTLVEITEPENAIEKPKKRQASEKQLAALAAAREKRKTKTNALDKAQQMRVPVPQAVAPPPPAPVADVVVKRTKPKRIVQKPTIIQIDSDSDSGDDEPPAPTIIIRNGSKKKAAEVRRQVPQVQEEYEEPRQYIRRAY
jgi:hypothetical protein